jgi:hypothetical protein
VFHDPERAIRKEAQIFYYILFIIIIASRSGQVRHPKRKVTAGKGLQRSFILLGHAAVAICFFAAW